MKTNTNKHAVWAGLLLCTALGASAVPVTFQVNLEYQATNAAPTFETAGDTVQVKGPFNGWNGTDLVNVPGTYLYTNTIDVSGTPGDTIPFKYYTYGTHGGQWDSFLGYIYPGGNRSFVLGSAAQTLPEMHFGDIWGGTTPLTVQVDMLSAIIAGKFTPGVDTVEIRGSFHTDWNGGIALTNDPTGATAPTNVYSITFDIGPDITSTAPNGLCAYKFHTYGSPGHDIWESDPNRTITVQSPATVLPVTCFNRACLPPVPVALALQVDMTSQIAVGSFNPATDQVWADGDFLGGWGDPPAEGFQLFPVDGQPNVYSNYWTGSMSPGANFPFKFKMWATSTGAGQWEGFATNRFLVWSGTEPTDAAGNHVLTLPLSQFGFWLVNSNDFLTRDTWVKFSVDMTGAVGVGDNLVFDDTVNTVYVNGPFVNPALTPFSQKWWPWVKTVVDPVPTAWAMTNDPPGSHIYSLEVLLPQGSPVRVRYKYSIDGWDDGGAANEDRYRDVRTEGLGTYVFPQDTFNQQYIECVYDPADWGRLAIGTPSGGAVPVQWLGRPGVRLQTATALSGTWTDLFNTDGTNWTAGVFGPDGLTSVTNYPAGGATTFFRLVKPGP